MKFLMLQQYKLALVVMVVASVFVVRYTYSEATKVGNSAKEPALASDIGNSELLPDPDTEFKLHSINEMYRQALIAVSAGSYQDARIKFSYFIRNFPSSHLIPLAIYWRGEASYGLSKYEMASEDFHIVSSRYPNSNKAPDALLKLGLCKLKLDNLGEGLVILELVTVTYPSTPAALRAEQEIGKRDDVSDKSKPGNS